MNSVRFPASICAGLVVLLIAQLVYCYPLLPEMVASHFDADGIPNGWMSKTALVMVMLFATLISAGTIAGMAILLPHVQDGIKIPNKAYWFADERREAAMAFISSSLMWIGCAVVALLLVINHFVFRLNIEGEKTLALPMIPTLIVFLAVVGIIVIRLNMHFKHKEA